MLGFIISLFYAAYLAVVNSAGTETVYLAATGFLYTWYFWWTIILGVIVGIIALVSLVGGGIVGSGEGRGALGALGGTVLGGGVSLLIIIVFAIRRGLFLGGAYLLNTALVVGADGSEWNSVRLLLGGLFLLIAFLTASSSSSSSSSSD